MITRKTFLTLVVAAASATLVAEIGAHSNFGGGSVAAQIRPLIPSLSGSWIVQVNPDPPLVPYLVLGNFTSDGTATSSSAYDPIAPAGSPSYGEWMTIGPRRFAVTIMGIVFDEDPQKAGTFKINWTLTLNEKGDEASGPLKGDVFDHEGNVLFSFSGTTHAKRIRVEPLK